MDIFISYAHIDNVPLTEGQPGWISHFHRNLELRLNQLLGLKPEIWRDPKLAGTDVFGEVILQKLPQAKMLVSIVSPRYVKSEWCLREAAEFLSRANSSGGVVVHNKSRLVKVVKTPVSRTEIPPPLGEFFNGQLGFEFYQLDPETGRPHEFDEEFGSEAKRLFFDRIYDLAYSLCELLRMLPGGAQAPIAAPSGRTVYLATTTADLQEERERLRRELQERGHAVRPDAQQPTLGSAFEAAVRDDLARSDLAVQLIGRGYGLIPEDRDESIIELQNRLAAERGRNAAFARFLWVPRDLVPRDERQRAFVRRLFEDPAAQHGAEIVQDSLERLKGLVLEKLAPPAAPPPAPPPGGPARVYLICDRADDGPLLQALEDYLFNQGLEISRPSFEGNESEVSAAHRQQLQFCDGVLIYYGAASRTWVDMKLLDLAQAPGYGRVKPFRSTLVCVAPPEDRNKQRFRTHTAEVLRLGETLDGGLLEPFMRSLAGWSAPGT